MVSPVLGPRGRALSFGGGPRGRRLVVFQVGDWVDDRLEVRPVVV